MSAFQNMMAGIGGLANSAGATGDGPGGINGMQRAALSPEQAIAVGKQTAISKLAADPDFQILPPIAKQRAITAITGDPAALSALGQQEAMASIDLNNPQSAIKTLQQYMTPEQVTGIVTDPMKSGMIGLSNSTANPGTPPTTTSAPAAGGVAPSAGAAPSPVAAPLTPVDYVKTHVPAFYQNQVMDILQGGELPKDIPQKDRNVLMNWAHNADPDFSESTAAQRTTMIKNATSGDMYKLGTSLNTGMGHLYDLHELADGLHQGAFPVPLVTGVANTLSKNLMPGGNPELERYESALKTSAPEIAKYLGGGAATDTGTEEAQSSYAASTPPKIIKANALDLGAKMMTKGGSLQQEYNSAMGAMANTPAGKKDVVHEMTAALYADMQQKPLTLDQQRLVNQHRAEANLPLKKWGKDMTVSKPVAFHEQADNLPTPEQALQILRQRGKVK